MKKATLVIIALALVALLATAVWARGPYSGSRGGGYGGGYCYGASGAVNQEAFAKFQTDTLQLRQELAANRVELHTLLAQPQPDQARVKALSDQVTQLREQLAKKAHEAGVAGGYGRGFARGRGDGYGPGYRACWR